MGRSSIEWCTDTWQVTAGCTRHSKGCEKCYAEVMSGRLAAMAQTDLDEGRNPGKKLVHLAVVNQKPGAGVNGYGPKSGWNRQVVTLPENLEEPLRWKKPRRIFVNSMSDLFHADVPFEFVDRVFAVMAQAHWHTYQVLTKRAQRMAEYFGARNSHLAMTRCFRNFADYTKPVGPWPLPNVWLGVSAEDQQRADERIPHLIQCPAAVRFVSAEPLLGEIDFGQWLREYIPSSEMPGWALNDGMCDGWRRENLLHQVIFGGESGPGARPCDPAWIRSGVQQCQAAGVACFVKQMGSVWAGETIINGTSVRAHGDPKGGDPQWWPSELRVRQMPGGVK